MFEGGKGFHHYFPRIMARWSSELGVGPLSKTVIKSHNLDFRTEKTSKKSSLFHPKHRLHETKSSSNVIEKHITLTKFCERFFSSTEFNEMFDVYGTLCASVFIMCFMDAMSQIAIVLYAHSYNMILIQLTELNICCHRVQKFPSIQFNVMTF